MKEKKKSDIATLLEYAGSYKALTFLGLTLSGIAMVLMFVFDWRMGAACLLAAVISVAAMFTMMGGKNAKLMQEYQTAQDHMSKAGTEYVRGTPVVKVFQQTVYSFKAFKEAIEAYSKKAELYTIGVCQVPQSINLTFTEGAFIFLVPVAVLIAPGALKSGNFAGFVTNFAFYAVFSAIVSTALAKIMFAASGMMLASTALGRIAQIMDAPIVVLDEATAFADPENEVLIQKAFGVLTKGKTVIMIAHRLSTVVGADKIIVLDNGHAIEMGTHDELKRNNGMYSRMWTDYNQAVQWRISAGEAM